MLVGDLVFNVLQPILRERIYPGVLDGAVLPAAVYQEISGIAQNTVDGGFTGVRRVLLQVDFYAESYEETKRAAAEGAQLLCDQSYLVCLYLTDRYLYETETRRHRISVDFSIWEVTP